MQELNEPPSTETPTMRAMVRPTERAIAGGVSAAIADRFGVSIVAVRFLWIAALNASDLAIALYVLLWLSIPADRIMLGKLRLASGEWSIGSALEQNFRVHGLTTERRVSRAPLGLAMILFAIWMQLGKFSPIDPFRTAPMMASFAALAARLSSAIFYLACGFVLLIPSRGNYERLYLFQPRWRSVRLDTSDRKALFGLVAGLSNVLGIEVGLLRVLLVLGNVLTLGAMGGAYVIGVLYLRTLPAVEDAPRHPSQHPLHTFIGWSRRIAGGLCLLLTLVRISTEYRFFFFNEPFVTGIVFTVIGILAVGCTLAKLGESSRARVLTLLGTAIILFGLYQLSTAVYNVQLTFTERFALAFFIAALSFLYYSLVALEGKQRISGVMVTGLFLISLVAVLFNVLSSRFLVGIVQFYLYFNPVLYAAVGLWLVLDRSRRSGVHIREWLTLEPAAISGHQTTNGPDPLPLQ